MVVGAAIVGTPTIRCQGDGHFAKPMVAKVYGGLIGAAPGIDDAAAHAGRQGFKRLRPGAGRQCRFRVVQQIQQRPRAVGTIADGVTGTGKVGQDGQHRLRNIKANSVTCSAIGTGIIGNNEQNITRFRRCALQL